MTMKFATPLTIALVIANNVGRAAAAMMMMTTPGSEPETETEMEVEVLRPHGSKGEAPVSEKVDDWGRYSIQHQHGCFVQMQILIVVLIVHFQPFLVVSQ